VTELRAPVSASGNGTVTVRVVEALRALGTVTDRAPLVLGYHPVAKMNPFQALLYREAWDLGVAPVPVVEEAGIDELTELARLGHPVALHLHWLNKPIHHAATVADARRGADAFLARIDAFRAAGGRLAWTVHNVLPHATRFEAEEARLRGAVAGRADVIHVMAADTASLVAPHFELPADRVLHVPHPGYQGAYADTLGRGQARFELGIPPDELVYLVLGAIQPYKGIDDLLDAWDALPLDGVPRRLVIAGGPSREPGVDALLDRAYLHPSVVLHARRIEGDRMQVFLRAADVAVLPYRRSLNSGAQLLAFTFGLPVIVPAGGGLAESVDGSNGITYTQGDADALAEALVAAGRLATPAARAAALATAQAVEPSAISRRFVEGLRSRLGLEGGA
jgi:glycosyltransferase involved in cell wall biosynthesis